MTDKNSQRSQIRRELLEAVQTVNVLMRQIHNTRDTASLSFPLNERDRYLEVTITNENHHQIASTQKP